MPFETVQKKQIKIKRRLKHIQRKNANFPLLQFITPSFLTRAILYDINLRSNRDRKKMRSNIKKFLSPKKAKNFPLHKSYI